MYILVFIPFFFEGGLEGGRGWRDIFSWENLQVLKLENLATMQVVLI